MTANVPTFFYFTEGSHFPISGLFGRLSSPSLKWTPAL